MVYRLFWFTFGPLIKTYWWVRARGRANVPRDRGAILACNHVAAIDPVLVCMSFWRPVAWLAKVELVMTRRVAWFFRGAGVIPVNRGMPETTWMRTATDVLACNKLFGIFPEGTRSPDGRIYKGFTGVARIAEMSGAPVIPTGIVGTRKAHRKGRRLARPVACEVRFGAPMRFEVRPGEHPQAAYHRFTDEVLDAIAALIGAERVRDQYSRRTPRRAAS